MGKLKRYGLIGYPLSHSFSKKYFTDKFEEEKILNHQYDLFPIQSIEDLPTLISEQPNLLGFNVTIPYKEQVLPYLDAISDDAKAIGAVNTVMIEKGKLIGFNTDVYGFENSLKNYIKKHNLDPFEHGLILGTGGAAKAVAYVLEKLGIKACYVSRTSKIGKLTYQDLDQKAIKKYHLIINTTPLGMHPKVSSFPDIPYKFLTEKHLLFDLVYNPKKTVFLSKGKENGAHILNGLEMLIGQAERSWEIWNVKHTI